MDAMEIISFLFPGKHAQTVFFVRTKCNGSDARRKHKGGRGVGGVSCVCVSSVQWSQREASGVCEALLSQHIPSPSTTSLLLAPPAQQQPPLWVRAVVLQSRAPPTCDRPLHSSSWGQRSQPCWPPVDPPVDPQVDPAGYLLCQLQKARIIQSHSH